MTNKILKNMLLTLGATSLLVVPSIVMASCSTGGSDTKPPVDPGGDGGGTKPPIDPPIKKPPLNLVNKTISQTFKDNDGGMPIFRLSLGSYVGDGSADGFIGDFNENLIYNLKADIKIDSYKLYYGGIDNIIVPEFIATIDLDFSFKLTKITGESGIDFYNPVMKYEGNNNEYFDAPGDTLTSEQWQTLRNGILSKPLDPSFIINDKDKPALNGQKKFQIGFGENSSVPLSIMVSPAIYKNEEKVIISSYDKNDKNHPNKDKKMTMTYSITPKK